MLARCTLRTPGSTLAIATGSTTPRCAGYSIELLMPSSTPVVALLADLGKVFGKLRLRWYVFGAQAAIVHGVGRLTFDVDVTIDLARTPITDLLAALAKRGFIPQIPDPRFIEVTRVIPLVHQPSDMPVDLVLAGPGLEDLFFERAVPTKLGRALVNVASLEDLIVMKILSGRPKDMDDVETLLAVRRDDVDLKVVRRTLRLAEELIDQSDLRPAFERLLVRSPRARRVSASEKSRKKKRG